MHLPTVSYCALHIPWTFQTKHVPRLSPSFSPDTATWVYHLVFNDSSVYWGTLVWDLLVWDFRAWYPPPLTPPLLAHWLTPLWDPLCWPFILLSPALPSPRPWQQCVYLSPCLLTSTSSAWLAHSPQGSFSCIDSATLWYKSLSMTHCHL